MELASSIARRSRDFGLCKEKENVPAPSEMQSPHDSPISSENVSVYRAPHRLKDPSRREALTPQVVSLGPYHHGNERLKKMEPHRRRFLDHVLLRTGKDKKIFTDSMEELEIKARACYEEQSHLPSDIFVEMMLLDGCFILEILQGAGNGFEKLGYDTHDPIFSGEGTLWLIRHDMIMLENQIPLFVLDKLLALQKRVPDQNNDVVKLAVEFFDDLMPMVEKTEDSLLRQIKDVLSDTLMPTGEPSSKMASKMSAVTTMSPSHASIEPSRKLPGQPGLHCLNVFRERFLYEGPESRSDDNSSFNKLNFCATGLRDAGIKFKKGNNDELWNITFENGILCIPPIRIDDGFKSLLLNLIAFEQCHVISNNHITSYVFFLDNLIDSPEDVKYLKNHGIIEHMLGSDDEVASVINCLCRGVYLESNYLSSLSWKINDYRNQKWHTWRATLKERYFNSPWAIISFVAAVLLLIMTAAQTFYAVYNYYKPNN